MGRIAYWGALTAPEIAALDSARAIAVLPVGAIEQRGPHLGTGTDADLAQAVLARALPRVAADLTVLALPTLPYGKSTEHEARPGTLSLSAATLLAVVGDIGASRGIHGGNVETSAMLAAHPERVRMDQARDYRSAHESWGNGPIGLGRPVVPGWLIGDLTLAGAVGNAAAATAAKGEALLDGAAQGPAEALAAFDRFAHAPQP